MSKTPEEISVEVAERIKLAGVGGKPEEQGANPATPAGTTPAMSQEQIEEAIEKILGARAKKVTTPPVSSEPDWASVSERQALDISNSLSIPVIEHEVPAYMDIRLADPEYLSVWANRDQRRLGQLLAEGYEFLRKEHLASDFPLPLKFDSEGMYIYQDVVAMRVHKRILFGKRRRVVEQSYAQLKGPQALAKSKLSKVISNDSHLQEAFEEGSLGYYEPSEKGI